MASDRSADGRNGFGQFAPGHGAIPEQDKLQNVVAFKISNSELRRYAKLFDHHAKAFGWETHADMHRDMLDEGSKVIEKMIMNLDPELKRMREESDEREQILAMGLRHYEFERTIRTMEEHLDVLLRNKDFVNVRRALSDFVKRTEQTKDPVIRRRREETFEQMGWEKMQKELNRGENIEP